MALAFWSESPRYSARRLSAAWLAAVAASAAFLCLALWSLRAEALRAGERYAQSLVRLAGEQTSRSIQTVGQALALAETDLAELAEGGRLTEASARGALTSQLRYLPYVRALWFIDARGVIRYDSDVGNIGVSLADRDYFQIHLQEHPELFVGQPVRSRSLGTWLVSASRASRRPDGTLLGVYTAAIEPPYFDRLWRSVALGKDGVVGLFSNDGVMMLRSPWSDAAVGTSFRQAWPFSTGLAGSEGHAVVTSRVDGRTRMMSYRRLDGFPDLVIVVGVDYQLVLGPWKRFAAVSVSLWGVAVALLTLALAAWARDRRARLDAEHRSATARRLEAVGTLAGGIAHDFNNVIGAVLGHARIARHQVGHDSPAHDTLHRIETSGLRARALVQQILAFSRGEPEARAQIDLRPLVEETVGLLRATLPTRIRLSTQVGAHPVVVTADPGQIQQVVMNLCTNAWQAIDDPAGGVVDVGLGVSTAAEREAIFGSAQGAGAQAHVWVKDSGKGIPPEVLERMFEPFFTTKPKGVGTGLGLSVVHRIVSAHGGTVLARSSAGGGTTFHVFLPLSDAQAQTPEPDDDAPLDGDGLRVLCVDDDEVILAMLDGVLSAQHFDVVVARSPEEALACLQAPGPRLDAVVTDHDMPTGSGIDLALRVRELAPALPVVLMSGFISDDIEAEARRAGVVALVPKERAYAELGAAILRASAS